MYINLRTDFLSLLNAIPALRAFFGSRSIVCTGCFGLAAVLLSVSALPPRITPDADVDSAP
jgi:hypothetical protein